MRSAVSLLVRVPALSRRGFTLLETVLSLTLVAGLLLLASRMFRGPSGLFGHALPQYVIERELSDIMYLLRGTLRRADAASIVIESTPEGPWTRIRYAAGKHTYSVYGQGGSLWMQVDKLKPKQLSSHLIHIQFAPARSRLPTLLTWSVTLGATRTAPQRVSFSGVQFLNLPSE